MVLKSPRCAHIEAPDLQHSTYLTRLDGQTLWLGFIHIKGLDKKLIQALLDQRSKQPFTNQEDFTQRVPAGLEQLLIRVGEFRGLGSTKKKLLWQAHALVNNYTRHLTEVDLFTLPELNWSLPALWQDALEDTYDELKLLGFPLRSPFALLAGAVQGIRAAQLRGHAGKWVAMTGYPLACKRITAKNGRPIVFGYFMDVARQYFDTTYFPQTQERYSLRGAGLYLLEGKVVLEYGFPSLEVRRLEKCQFLGDSREV
ncbi:helix-hairpin-helix domain-containing protein [Spirosoma fluviale]|uniref:helix-hairpin-helix domain-containing protein n=1 Tax=Spirosoma fluviale TaxID=1597977 RepID=UPI000BE2FFBD|nr:hypothetical protein [Spirosoma fluviale]